MTKSEIASHLADKAGVTKAQATAVLASLTDLVHIELRSGREVALHELGTFRVKNVAERKGISPAIKQPYVKPAHKAPKFKAAKALQDAVA